jgi:manganese efflux pump family protein
MMDGMDLLSILFIALSLSADCFAVSLGGCVSIKNLKYVQVFRTSIAFGVAQTLMPVIGWLVGSTLITLISGFDHWVAFGLLIIVGGRMIWEAFHEKDGQEKCLDITRGMLLFSLAFVTSIDALAVGLSFALLQINIIFASLLIGIVAFIITHLGFYLGRKAGRLLGQRAKIAGGGILIFIGFRILLSHLLS